MASHFSGATARLWRAKQPLTTSPSSDRRHLLHVLQDFWNCIFTVLFLLTPLPNPASQAAVAQAEVSLAVIGGFDCVTTVNCRICHKIFCFVLIVAFADEELLAVLKSIFCHRIAKWSAIGILFILNSSRACLASVTHFSALYFSWYRAQVKRFGEQKELSFNTLSRAF